MSSTPPSAPIPDLGKTRESLSQFVARVLDQLSISAWLPAGLLVSGLLLIGELWRSNGVLPDAIASIGGLGWSAIALLLASTVLATMVTQAFGFGAIRVLEGYWGIGRLARGIAELSCRRQIRHRVRLEAAWTKARKEGAAFAGIEMGRLGFPTDVILAMQLAVVGGKTRPSPAAAESAKHIRWKDYADPSLMRRLEATQTRLEEYPPLDRRVLPTRLGNIVRASEDRAFGDEDSDLESRVMMVFHTLPLALQSQHDEHRNRLDLYASMIFVLLTLEFSGLAVLLAHPITVLGVLLICSAGMWLSYRGLVASARGYGSALEAIAEWERRAATSARSNERAA